MASADGSAACIPLKSMVENPTSRQQSTRVMVQRRDWRQEMEKYTAVRHPYIIQLYGGSSAGGIHALLFHGDLVPYKDFMRLYRHSLILTVYICAYTNAQFMAAESYLYSSYQQLLNPMHCLFWIRRSTGLLSIDFGSDFSDAGDNSGPRRYASAGTGIISNRHSITSLDTSDEELLAIEWLSLEQFHEICYWNLSKVRPISSYAVSASARINLGAVIAKSSLEQGAVTLLQYAEPFDLYPITVWPECGERMDDGQIRFDSHSISNIVLEFEIGAQYPNAWLTQANPSTWLNQTNPGTWLSQANHIFERLQVTTPADLESYALVDFVRFHLRIPPIAEDSPAGYLFTRPQEYFGCGPGSLDQPDHLADWSLHPSATDRLSSTEAEHLGFPPFHLTSEIYLRSWNASVYAGLRKFHAAKGFDPASQDIARHLGCPLYKLPSDPHVPLVHGDLVDDEDQGTQQPTAVEDDRSRESANEDSPDGEAQVVPGIFSRVMSGLRSSLLVQAGDEWDGFGSLV